MSKRAKRTSVAKPKSDTDAEIEAGNSNEQREVGGAPTGQVEIPASLIAPTSTESRHYLEAIDKFQEELCLAGSDIRVCHATIPTDWAPPSHIGAHAGFPVATGKVFEVRINTGQIIQPKE